MRKDMIALSMIFLIPVFMAVVYSIFYPLVKSEEFEIKKTEIEIENIKMAIVAFKKDVGIYPDSADGLKALLHYSNNQYWKGPYIDADQLKDSWGVQYKYEVINRQQGGLLFIVGSSGKNKKWETTENHLYQELSEGDDIVRYFSLENE
jgi:hypothetical protein